jgi:hypothetical protein
MKTGHAPGLASASGTQKQNRDEDNAEFFQRRGTRVGMGNHTESTGASLPFAGARSLCALCGTQLSVEASFRRGGGVALYLSPVATRVVSEHAWPGGDF